MRGTWYGFSRGSLHRGLVVPYAERLPRFRSWYWQAVATIKNPKSENTKLWRTSTHYTIFARGLPLSAGMWYGRGSSVNSSKVICNYLFQADPRSDPHARHILSERFGHEINSTTILLLHIGQSVFFWRVSNKNKMCSSIFEILNVFSILYCQYGALIDNFDFSFFCHYFVFIKF